MSISFENRKIWRRSINFLFFLAALIYFGYFFKRSIADMPPLNWSGDNAVVILGTALLYALTISLMGLAWGLLLRDGGLYLPMRDVQTIYAISQFGKYLPGNVGQHVGRVMMATSAGIPTALILSSMVIEMLWVAGVGAIVSTFSVIFFIGVPDARSQLSLNLVWLTVAAVLLMCAPWLAIKTLNRLSPRLITKLIGDGVVTLPSFQTALGVAFLVLLCFGVFGVVLKLHAEMLFSVSGVGVFELTCLFAAAWLAGFLVPGAPGGLGVRELTMVFLLSPVVGEAIAVGLGLTLRLTTTLGDLLAFLIGYLVRLANTFSRA